MSAKYCGSCGFKSEYGAIPPKFCTNCGDPFDKAFRVEAKKTARQEPDEEQSGDSEVAALRFEIKGTTPNVEPTFAKATKEWAESGGGGGGRNLSKTQIEVRANLSSDKVYGDTFGRAPRSANKPAQDGPVAPCDI